MVLGAVKSPPVLVLLMFVPLLAMVLITLLQLKQLHEYAVHYDRRIGWYTYVWVVLTQLPYQWLLSYSALLAVLRHSTNRTDWQSPARAGDLLPRPLPQLAGAVE